MLIKYPGATTEQSGGHNGITQHEVGKSGTLVKTFYMKTVG